MIQRTTQNDIEIGSQLLCIYDSDGYYYGKVLTVITKKDDHFTCEFKTDNGLSRQTMGIHIDRISGDIPFSRANRYMQMIPKRPLTEEDLFLISLLGNTKHNLENLHG